MEQETLAAQTIETVGTDPRYDESVKRLLANKSILAVILKECVPEFKHCTTREIAEQYIEGEPQIGINFAAIGPSARRFKASVTEF